MSGKCVDWNRRVGERFGRLVIVGIKDIARNRKGIECKCDCGNTIIVSSYGHLASGKKRSCGCLKKEIESGISLPEDNNGMTKEYEAKCREYHNIVNDNSRLYRIWSKIKQRTGNTNWIDANKAKYYVGKGVKMCDEWKYSYAEFYKWSMSHGYDDKLTIDRIDVNGNYEPSNCRWVDQKTQMRNMTKNHNVTMNGETRCVSEWCELFGITLSQVYGRAYRHNITIDESLDFWRKQILGWTTPSL